jgi:hypothetical protein
VAWDLERERNNCTDDLEDRFVFDLDLGPAADDGGRESLALMVFQTAGPQVQGPVQVLYRPLSTGPARIRLPVTAAVGHVCFSAQVRDLAGRVSASAQRELCVETTAPPFFHGCAIGGRGDGKALLVLLVVLWRWRRRR